MYLPCYRLPEAHRLLVEKGPDQADGSPPRLSRRDAASDGRVSSRLRSNGANAKRATQAPPPFQAGCRRLQTNDESASVEIPVSPLPDRTTPAPLRRPDPINAAPLIERSMCCGEV